MPKSHRRYHASRAPHDEEEWEAEEERERASTDAASDEAMETLLETVKEVPDDWRELLESRLRRLVNVTREKGDADRKTLDEVFDKATLLTLWKFISNGLIETIDYPLSTGKEANVFHATTRDNDSLAVKIFRTNTATFRSFMTYIQGDPRFGNVGRDRRDIVHTWAQKEYKNLQRYFEAGVHVPRPIAYRQNVLLMEFVGTNGAPAPQLRDLPPDDPQEAYETIVADYRRGLGADLVHGDLSEYNVLNQEGELFIIDVAQAVLTRHPMARELLERDARNISRYFRKLGVKTTPEEAKAAMKPPEKEKLKAEGAVTKEEDA